MIARSDTNCTRPQVEPRQRCRASSVDLAAALIEILRSQLLRLCMLQKSDMWQAQWKYRALRECIMEAGSLLDTAKTVLVTYTSLRELGGLDQKATSVTSTGDAAALGPLGCFGCGLLRLGSRVTGTCCAGGCLLHLSLSFLLWLLTVEGQQLIQPLLQLLHARRGCLSRTKDNNR